MDNSSNSNSSTPKETRNKTLRPLFDCAKRAMITHPSESDSQDQDPHQVSPLHNADSASNVDIDGNDSTPFPQPEEARDVVSLPRGGVLYNQDVYYLNSRGQGVAYYKCSLYPVTRCKARLVERTGQFIQKGKEHNHEPGELSNKLDTVTPTINTTLTKAVKSVSKRSRLQQSSPNQAYLDHHFNPQLEFQSDPQYEQQLRLACLNQVKCSQEDVLEEVISVNEDTKQNQRLRIVMERSKQLRQLIGLEFERTGNTVKIKIVPKTSFSWQRETKQE